MDLDLAHLLFSLSVFSLSEYTDCNWAGTFLALQYIFIHFFNDRNPVWMSEFGIYVDDEFKSFQQFPDLTDADITECQRNVKVSGEPGVTYDSYFTSAINLTDDDDLNELVFDNAPDASHWGDLSEIISSFIKQMLPGIFDLGDIHHHATDV